MLVMMHVMIPAMILVMYSYYDYCATLILYAWIFGGMRQRYIYEGFLVWIIPSMY